ncbi:hypothetical protein B4U80_13650 [Leptotrombidium deliense]|uniref:Carboxylesterase type B domain-containing protein n=1 Tax=Leptotrombidium deliense TaxID=299467 RepID=A0A443SPP3_9ACAR|nr:hypothetical protein B4U80_13650 [Leptotrombidium deliense]
MIKAIAFFLFANLNYFNCQNVINTLVSTSYGNIRGSANPMATNPQRFIVSFYGIPYAQPPINTNRLRNNLKSFQIT